MADTFACRAKLMTADRCSQRSSAEPSPSALSRGEWLPSVVGSVSLEIRGGPAAPSQARHAVLDALSEVLDETERSNFELLVSELVTNCVRHGGMSGED